MPVNTYGMPASYGYGLGGGGSSYSGSSSGSALGGIASWAGPIGSVIGGLLGSGGARSQRRWDARQAEINRQWQERMSNTAVQRRMADMASAGVNPILAARHDANTPAGAMPAASPNTATAGLQGAQTAMGLAQMKAAIKNVNADTEVKGTQAAMNTALAGKAYANTGESYSATSLNRVREDREYIAKFLDRVNAKQMQWLFGGGSQAPNQAQKIAFLIDKMGLTKAGAYAVLRLFAADDNQDWMGRAERTRKRINNTPFSTF